MAIVPAAHTANRPWKPLAIQSKLTVTGGFTNRTHTLTTLDLHDGGDVVHFVEVTKNAEWFLKSAGGNDTQKGHVKAVTILDKIEVAVQSHIDGNSTGSAVAGDSQDSAEVDPMDMLDDLEHDNTSTSRKPKSKKAKHEIVTVHMSSRPYDPDAPDVAVSVYYSGRNGKKLLVRSDNLPWLLAYAADEVHYQGVSPIAVADEPRRANCAAVAGLNVEWNFQQRTWEAEFVEGHHRGTKRKFSPDLFDTAGRWEKLQRKCGPDADDAFKDTPLLEKQRRARHMLIHWCKAITNDATDAFEAEWDLGSAAVAA